MDNFEDNPSQKDEYVDFSRGVDFPNPNKRRPMWQIGVAIGVGLLLVAALISALFGNDKSDNNTKAPPPTVIADDGDGSKSTSTTSGSTGTTTPDDVAIRAGVISAFSTWSHYITTGDQRDLDVYFVKGGEQYNALIAAKDSTAKQNFSFQVVSSSVEQSSPTLATVTVNAVVYQNRTKQGNVTLKVNMQRGEDGKWRVAAVNKT